MQSQIKPPKHSGFRSLLRKPRRPHSRVFLCLWGVLMLTKAPRPRVTWIQHCEKYCCALGASRQTQQLVKTGLIWLDAVLRKLPKWGLLHRFFCLFQYYDKIESWRQPFLFHAEGKLRNWGVLFLFLHEDYAFRLFECSKRVIWDSNRIVFCSEE